MTVVINGNRHPNLGGGNHIDGRFIALKNFKNLTHETIGQQHAPRFDANGGYAVFGSNGFDVAFYFLARYGGAGGRRIKGVQEAYRYIGQLGWKHAGWVQNFCAKISQLSRLIERQLGDGPGTLHITDRKSTRLNSSHVRISYA